VTPASRSLWINGALLFVAVLTSVVLVVTSRSVTTAERQTRARHLLTAFRLDDVSQVSVDKAGETWVVRRGPREPDQDAGARWQLVSPLQGDAEEATIDQLLRTAQFATWLRHIDDADVDRERFGLDSPKVVVSIDMGELHYRVRLGGAAPSPPGASYVEVTGEGVKDKGVYVIGESTADDLDPDVEDFRIRQIIPYAGSALRAIDVGIDQRRVELERGDDDAFRIGSREAGTRVGTEALDRILLTFSRTVAKSFLPIGEAQRIQSGSRDVLSLKLTPKAKEQPALISIGGSCPTEPGLVVAVRTQPKPSAACIDDVRLHELFARPELLLDHDLFTLRPDEVEAVEIAQGERHLRLLRAEDGFVLREPSDGKVSTEAAVARIKEMLEVRGELLSEPDLSELGLAASAHRVTLSKATSQERGERETIELSGTTPDGKLFARRLSDGAVLALNPTSRRLFTADGLLLLDEQLLDLNPDGVSEIRVERGPALWVLRQPQRGEYELVEPTGYAVDPALASAWIEGTRQLSVERWVAEEDDGSFGLAKPLLAFAVTDVQRKTLRVVVGGRAAGGYFARVTDRPQVMVIAKELVDTLTMLIVDRSGFTVDPDLAVDVELRTVDQVVKLERLGTGFVQTDGTLQLDPPRITELVDALGLVRPEAAIALSSNGTRYDFSAPVLDVSFRYVDGASKTEHHYVVGPGDSYRNLSVHAARIVGSDAVYVIPRQQIARVLELL